jgi:ribosomal protein S17
LLIRFEESIIPEEDTRVTWEYRPHMMHVVDMGPVLGRYLVTRNLNQALTIFSQDQLKDLHNRCNYLTDIGQTKFYTELRWALNQDWKYLAVGVSEWSSSYQHVLQCGVRRIIPLDHLQTFMIHHTVDKAQKRRPRKELLTMSDWMGLVDSMKKNRTISLEEAYHMVHEQYNMHLIRPEKYNKKSKFTWEVEKE